MTTSPVPSVTDEFPDTVKMSRELLGELVRHIERNTCEHTETHRGGAIWEICDSCGMQWADDRGGKPEFKWPECIEKARDLLAGGDKP